MTVLLLFPIDAARHLLRLPKNPVRTHCATSKGWFKESPDQENIPDSLLWENTKRSSWRKSGQAQKLDIYDCLPPPSHEWLLHKQVSDHWMKVEEWRQSRLCINVFSASGPVNFIRIEFHTFFQKYPTQAFLSLLPGLSLISLAPKSCSLHTTIEIELADIFRMTPSFLFIHSEAAHTLPLYSNQWQQERKECGF